MKDLNRLNLRDENLEKKTRVSSLKYMEGELYPIGDTLGDSPVNCQYSLPPQLLILLKDTKSLWITLLPQLFRQEIYILLHNLLAIDNLTRQLFSPIRQDNSLPHYLKD